MQNGALGVGERQDALSNMIGWLFGKNYILIPTPSMIVPTQEKKEGKNFEAVQLESIL